MIERISGLSPIWKIGHKSWRCRKDYVELLHEIHKCGVLCSHSASCRNGCDDDDGGGNSLAQNLLALAGTASGSGSLFTGARRDPWCEAADLAITQQLLSRLNPPGISAGRNDTTAVPLPDHSLFAEQSDAFTCTAFTSGTATLTFDGAAVVLQTSSMAHLPGHLGKNADVLAW